MPRGLTDYQRTVLKNIGLHGSQHILSIQENTGLNYATTHRSVKSLEEKNLIWLQEKDPRGPKGAQYYGLTPYGVVELYLRGETRDLDKIIENWEPITPRIIVNYREVDRLIPIKKIIENIYPDVVRIYNQTQKKKVSRHSHPNSLTIQKNIVEGIILEALGYPNIGSISNIIKNDPKYKKTWKHWVSLKKLFHQNLLRIDNEIMEQ